MTELETRQSPLSSRRPLKAIARALARRPLAVVAIAYLIVIVVGCYGSGILAPYNPVATDFGLSYQLPSAQHLLGTDSLGRDILSRLMAGGVQPLNDVLTALSITLILGIPAGIVAGYFGGAIDWLTSRWADIVIALPGLIILLVVLTIFPGSSFAPMVAFGVLLVGPVLRVIRSATLSIRTELHVEAAKLAGLTPAAIMRRHVLPRVMGPILVQATLISGAILLFSTSLGFLGFGPQPPLPTWGSMITEASTVMALHPWLLVPTGAVIILTVLAFNVLGDTLRDLVTERWAGPRPVTTYRKPLEGSRRAERDGATAAAGDPSVLLDVRDLSIAFGDNDPVTVVDRVSFSIRENETVGLVGESGCGKSVTARALLGLLAVGGRITEGSVTLSGRELTGLTDSELSKVRGTEISYISQDPMLALDPSFTIGKLVGEAVVQHEGIRGAARRDRVIELLTAVRLRDPDKLLRAYPHQISGGMAQRVVIARALAGHPKLLVADEPTTALDVTVQADILDLIRELQASTGMAVLFITHDWGVVADVCQRSIVMYAGQVVETAESQPLFDLPMHPYTAGLLASVPERGYVGQRLPMVKGSVPQPTDWPTGCHFATRCPYATVECEAGPIPLVRPAADRQSRCIHIDRLVSGEAAS